ncbi:MAG: hypothetical protein ACK5U7_07590 [Bacteroidota bacterium]|jgi:hypothetical protein
MFHLATAAAPSVPDLPPSIYSLLRESIVLVTIGVGIFGLYLLTKFGLIPLATVIKEGLVNMAEASANLKEGSRNINDGLAKNLELTRDLRDIHLASRKD